MGVTASAPASAGPAELSVVVDFESIAQAEAFVAGRSWEREIPDHGHDSARVHDVAQDGDMVRCRVSMESATVAALRRLKGVLTENGSGHAFVITRSGAFVPWHSYRLQGLISRTAGCP